MEAVIPLLVVLIAVGLGLAVVIAVAGRMLADALRHLAAPRRDHVEHELGPGAQQVLRGFAARIESSCEGVSAALGKPREVTHAMSPAVRNLALDVLASLAKSAGTRREVSHSLHGETITSLAAEAARLIRLGQLGVTEIPKAQPFAPQRDIEQEARAASREAAIGRGAAQLLEGARRIGATLTEEQARKNATLMVDRATQPEPVG